MDIDVLSKRDLVVLVLVAYNIINWISMRDTSGLVCFCLASERKLSSLNKMNWISVQHSSFQVGCDGSFFHYAVQKALPRIK